MTSRIKKLFPHGEIIGNYIQCGDIYGNAGKSFKFNTENELWSDFSTGQSGKGLRNLLKLRGDAENNFKLVSNPIEPTTMKKTKKIKSFIPTKPLLYPERQFRISLRPGGKLFKVWEYKNENSETCFYIARYDYKDGSKEVVPYSFDGEKWVASAWPTNRPLYNSNKIELYNKIMIVEGEKCADLVSKVFPNYIGVCWQGGSNAVKKSNWALICNKDVVIFPDNDPCGYSCAREIEQIISHNNKVKVLPIYELDADDGYDLDDFFNDNFDVKYFRSKYGIR